MGVKVAVLLIAALSLPSGKPKSQDKVPTLTPEQKFYAQVDKANASLATFLRLDCGDKGEEAAINDLAHQSSAVMEMYKALPAAADANHDEAERLKETEAFAGFEDVAEMYVKMKSKACMPDPEPEKTPAPRKDDSKS